MKLGDARVFSVPTFSSDSAPRASTAVDRWVAGRIRASVPSARLRFVLWDGFELPYAGDAPVGTIVFRNRRALFSWVWNPDLNFGEAYMFGAVRPAGRPGGDALRDLPRPAAARGRASRRRASPSNDERAARENVHRHYDLGNDFYRLWLDREMLYTCAYFPSPDATLEDAQIAKMDRVCRKLRSQAGRARDRGRMRLGLAGAVHGQAIRRVGPRVQRVLRADRLRARPGEAKAACAAASSSSRTTTATSGASTTRSCRSACSNTSALGDYRAFGSVVERSLTGARPRAAALHRPEPARRAQPVDPEADFPRRVSAGAARSVRARAASRWNLSVLDVENLRLHYASTLDHWRRRFETRVRRGGADVRRDVRPRVAPVPRGIAGRVHHRHDAAVPGGLRARRQQRDSLDASLLSRRVSAGALHGRQRATRSSSAADPPGRRAPGALRRAGLDVLVLDAAVFPRDKVCAGWITPQVVTSLDLDVDGYRRGRTFQPISGFHVGLIDGGAGTETQYGRQVSFGIRRCEFDHYLLERSGARVEAGTPDHEPPAGRRSLDRERQHPHAAAGRGGRPFLPGCAARQRATARSGRRRTRRRRAGGGVPRRTDGGRRRAGRSARAVLLPRLQRVRVVLPERRVPQHRPRPRLDHRSLPRATAEFLGFLERNRPHPARRVAALAGPRVRRCTTRRAAV